MIDEDDRRLQRKPSRLDYLASKGQKLDIRAHQRTYQGAYVRTCLGCLSFSLLVMKLFSREFMPLGMVYQIYALVLCLASYLRSRNLDLYFINFNDPNWYNNYEVVQTEAEPQNSEDVQGSDKYYYKTSGNIVLWLTIFGILCYIVLFVLLARM